MQFIEQLQMHKPHFILPQILVQNVSAVREKPRLPLNLCQVNSDQAIRF